VNLQKSASELPYTLAKKTLESQYVLWVMGLGEPAVEVFLIVPNLTIHRNKFYSRKGLKPFQVASGRPDKA
jgi:hypothetical protein